MFSDSINFCGEVMISARDISIPASIAYVFSALFTDINPMTAATTVGLALLISERVTKPFFQNVYPEYVNNLTERGKKFINLLSFSASYFSSQYLVEKLKIDIFANNLLFGAFPSSRGFVNFILTATKISFFTVLTLIICGYLYKRYHSDVSNFFNHAFARIRGVMA
jgi:hypothetical protein